MKDIALALLTIIGILVSFAIEAAFVVLTIVGIVLVARYVLGS